MSIAGISRGPRETRGPTRALAFELITDLARDNSISSTSKDIMATFTGLPAELRILIWQYSFPGPRNMVLSWNDGCFSSNLTPPSVAHICHESREEALKHYNLFSAPHPLAHILFDNEVDTLFVTDDAVHRLQPWNLAKVERLRHFRFTNVMAQKCTT